MFPCVDARNQMRERRRAHLCRPHLRTICKVKCPLGEERKTSDGWPGQLDSRVLDVFYGSDRQLDSRVLDVFYRSDRQLDSRVLDVFYRPDRHLAAPPT